jgi:hypothetical protein
MAHHSPLVILAGMAKNRFVYLCDDGRSCVSVSRVCEVQAKKEGKVVRALFQYLPHDEHLLP